jgi:hypothetical protein
MEDSMITLEKWRERMRADMGLRDYRPQTREGYELATRLFLDWAKTEPAALTEAHVRAYFLFLREQKKQAPSSINVAICALRFFCSHAPVRLARVRALASQQTSDAAHGSEHHRSTRVARQHPPPRPSHGARHHLRARTSAR